MQRLWAVLETVLRKYPWALTLLALIPCAYFDAAGLTSLIGARLFKADVGALTRSGAPTRAELEALNRPSATYRVRAPAEILAHNIFDSDAGCLTCAPPPEAGAADASEGPQASANPMAPDSTPPTPCDGQIKIIGAIQGDDPLWSIVLASAGTNQAAMPYRLGQTLDGKTIASIGWHPQYGSFVLLRASPGGPRCFYAQNMPPREAPPPPRVTAAPPPPAPGEGGLAGEIEAGITREGNNNFSIRRGLVDRILENQAELMRTTRIMPHEQGGRVVGVQLFGVRPNSLLGRLGMQNGDVLNRINGLEIASPDRALEAYSRLRTADRLTVSVTRNGAPLNLDFNIR